MSCRRCKRAIFVINMESQQTLWSSEQSLCVWPPYGLWNTWLRRSVYSGGLYHQTLDRANIDVEQAARRVKYRNANETKRRASTKKYLTCTISSISARLMYPLPSRSYMLKAQRSFCSRPPREVTLRAIMNSLKSMVVSLLVSKVRNTCSANFEASP